MCLHCCTCICNKQKFICSQAKELTLPHQMRQFTKRESFYSTGAIPAKGQIFVSDMLNRLKLYLINDCISWPCARRPYVHSCRHGEDRQTASAVIKYLPQSCLLTAKHLMRKAVLVPTTWSSTDAHWWYMNKYSNIWIFMAHCCLQRFATVGRGPQPVDWLVAPHLYKGWIVA